MRSPGITGEGELRGQPANPGSPENMAVKTECVRVCLPLSNRFHIINIFTSHAFQYDGRDKVLNFFKL